MSHSQQLYELLGDGSEINIVCHNNPDPDCLASALALGRIAADAGIDERSILYSGQISHQQNRAFVNLLDIDLQPFEAATVQNRQSDSLLAFVDHSIPGTNNTVPTDTDVDIVIDHHPAEDIDARFVDHRDELGAAATILTEYVRTLDIDLDTDLATALLIAIRSDTLDFLRGATTEEYAAAGHLHEHADPEMIRQLSNPSVSGGTLDAISTAIDNRRTDGAVLISHVGRTTERDALPQAVDYLVRLEGVQTAIVFGLVSEAIHISARSPDPRVHVGNVLHEAFDDVGSGGGHHDVAGGEIPLGIFADYTSDDAQVLDIIEQIITERLVAELNLSETTED
ncbi:DHH family phosphoesterase [Halanaeroarchaeum sulfurireducens]|uniref:Phosphoesterase RecJ domain-containing protein n=1 Tax=Halanaeroarchaeum sulfurireducens TaxID=1604004 RepID=A0A0F7PBG4_9EURY|nr:bifunctional oligoribonuclease/PAP phosphatase NrnA [Halanaeroarchaeum sulfurireducens]AKH96984.1 phosphoesterase RecJ domain-containing protein [Halanaeroarchaeum sulfurireducens]ALG81385.1 phosphoesterase RecJ domain-containing protein [Halanaeroarchaeum sulfurireducens]